MPAADVLPRLFRLPPSLDVGVAALAVLLAATPGCDGRSNDDETTLEPETSESSGGTTDRQPSSGTSGPSAAEGDDSGTASTSSSTSPTSGDESEPVVILNGSFEVPELDPGCYDNFSNEDFNAVIEDVYAFGSLAQVDLYADCYGTTTEGVFHVGIAANGDHSDAIALALSGPLSATGYRIRLTAAYGQTGAATSTDIAVGLSNQPDAFGEEVGRTGALTDGPVEYAFEVSGEGHTFVTLQVVPDGDLGWAMIDAVVLEPIE